MESLSGVSVSCMSFSSEKTIAPDIKELSGKRVLQLNCVKCLATSGRDSTEGSILRPKEAGCPRDPIADDCEKFCILKNAKRPSSRAGAASTIPSCLRDFSCAGPIIVTRSTFVHI